MGFLAIALKLKLSPACMPIPSWWHYLIFQRSIFVVYVGIEPTPASQFGCSAYYGTLCSVHHLHNAYRYNDNEYIVQYLDAALFVANMHLHHPTYCDTYGTRIHDLRRDRAAF